MTDLTNVTNNIWPAGMAMDKAGYIWVAESYNGTTSQMGIESTSGINITSGALSPQGIAVGDNGNVWVADYTGCIVEIDPSTGGILHTYTVNGSPIGIAIDHSGNVWVTNYLQYTVTEVVGVAIGP
ncbi:MAG: hypothetical protein M1591_07130 [Deltaproteobacteria bacterium]|nr:hypothetical protein [Deltaproteobacteria bacterium]